MRSKCVKSKSAFVLLVWSFVTHVAYSIPYWNYVLKDKDFDRIFIYVTLTVIFCLSPIVGCFADIRFGRYKTLIGSIVVMTMALLIYLGLFVWIRYFSINSKVIPVLMGFSTVIVYIAYMAYDVTILHYGMDQLFDSPADHQSIFIHWFVWIKQVAQFLLNIESCINEKYSHTIFLINLVVATFMLMLIVGLSCLKQSWFVIDFPQDNPFKLIYQVIKYARNHRVPVRRSAFTYCEDEMPSRLDLGKTKYGGPFVTEQVEDVKAFCGILKIVFVVAPIYMMEIVINFDKFTVHRLSSCQSAIKYYNFTEDNRRLITFVLLDHGLLKSLNIVILLPIYVTIFRPLILHYIPTMLKRIALSMYCMIASLLVTTVSNILFYWKLDNTNTKCELHPFMSTSNPSVGQLAMSLQIFKLTFASLTSMIYYVALYEFICSQSPQSMKGILIGISYVTQGICQFIENVLITKLLYIKIPHSSICGIYYYLLNFAIVITVFLIFLYISKKYQLRKRDEVCHIYRFAEEYYGNEHQESLYDYSSSLSSYQ